MVPDHLTEDRLRAGSDADQAFLVVVGIPVVIGSLIQTSP
jgi:hypothetical protein